MKKTTNDILIDKFGVTYESLSDDEKDDFWSELPDIEKYELNQQYLLENENPEYDYLVCWEPGRFGDDEVVTDFETMYEVDYQWWEFQKQARWESIEEMRNYMEHGNPLYDAQQIADSINSHNEEYDKGYSIYLTGDWYRLIENGRMLYSQFIAAEWYLYHELETLLDDLQEEHIPYTFVDDAINFMSSNRHNYQEGDQYNAGGREKELVGYNSKIRKYQSGVMVDKIKDALKKHADKFTGKTFRTDRNYDKGLETFDPFTDFIFYDEQSLKNVKTKKFLKTFTEHQVDFSEFLNILNDLKKIVSEDFKEIYEANKLEYQKQ